jgi:ADP-ribose pyrophosphatase YjhB (NUDIX family)
VTDPAVTEAVATVGRTRVGAYSICRDAHGRILLARLSALEVDVGSWTLPGGGVDFGEQPDAAAVRELNEETGLEGEIDELAAVFSHVYRGSAFAAGVDLHFIGIVYRMRIVGGDLRDEIDGSTDTCAWFGEADLAGIRLVELAEFAVGLAFPALRRPSR